MITETLKFTVDTTNPACPYAIKLIVNGDVQWSIDHLTEQQLVEFTFDDEVEQEFTVEIHIDGKTSSFTSIDEQGNITQDSLISIDNFVIGEFDITQLVFDRSEYVHSFNDPELPSSTHVFGGIVGCNGFIKFKFSAPSYMWILENI